MITLHHLEYSQSFRVLWLLEELAVEYELKKYDRDKKTHLAPEAYKAISPMGTAPVITHGDVVLAETGAILEYILDLYPNEAMLPKATSPNRVRHLFWAHAAQASMMPLMLMDSIFRIIQTRTPALLNLAVKPVLAKVSKGFIQLRMHKILALAEQDLADKPWFGGEQLSIADILLIYPIESAQMRDYINHKYPNVADWLARVYQREAFIRAKAKDGRSSMVLPM